MWRRLSECKEGSAQMIGVVVALLVSIIIGVLIWYQMNTAVFNATGILPRLTTNTAAMNATRTMQTAVWNNTNATANTIWTLFPIVAVVVVAGIILAIVTNFGKGSGV